MTSSKTPPASSMPFTSSSSLATPLMRCVAASSKTPWVTADARAIPSIRSAIFCAPHTRRLTPRQQERLREAFTADEAHISVEVAYHCAQQVRDVFHQATPAQGRRLAAHLIQRLPTCPIPEIARLGRTLRKWKDALDAYFDTDGASNAPHRSHQQNHQTRKTHRQRLPQPHQLPTPNAPHHRRPRRLHPHPTLKSPTTRAANQLVARLNIEHQNLWGASHAHQMEPLQIDEQITTIKRRTAAGRVRHRPRSLEDSGGRSPLITWDLDLYTHPPTNTHSPTLNSEEPDYGCTIASWLQHLVLPNN